MKYIPLRNFGNIMAWNARIRAAYDAIAGILERLEALEATRGESVTADDSPVVETVVEPVTVAVDVEIEDVRKQAKEAGLSNWHNKSIKRLEDELAELGD